VEWVPKEYPGPDKVKTILARAKIFSSRNMVWVEHYAAQPDDYQRRHYWQLRAVLITYFGPTI
jgi:hypothetical protein